MGTGVLSLEYSVLGVILTTYSGADIKNEWTYNSTPPVRLYGVDRGNFTITST